MTNYLHYYLALEQAKKSYAEGGIPIGAVLVKGDDIIGKGHNQRVQQLNPILHGEMDCLQNAGRLQDYSDTILYTTLSPCMMCSGTIVQFKIKKVIIGENVNFEGNIPFLKEQGIEVELLNDKETIKLMANFIKEKPELWNEDISETKE
ncbi:MAG: nucleoside deaminase [Flavobacteriaceae bacterium]|nr:nucleoside deaminase [Flavobacteriaceae bacterium]